jgi:hypothetical protein
MPVNVQISLSSRNRWERLVVRILDSASGPGRNLNNAAALLLPVVELVDRQLVQRHLGTAAGSFTVRVGQQRLHFRMPLPTDPICDCVLYEVAAIRHDRVRNLWSSLRREEVEDDCLADVSPDMARMPAMVRALEAAY